MDLLSFLLGAVSGMSIIFIFMGILRIKYARQDKKLTKQYEQEVEEQLEREEGNVQDAIEEMNNWANDEE